MSELLVRVLPLALGAAISPAVLAAAVLLLSSPTRPVARGTAFAAGFLTMVGVLTAVGLTVVVRRPAAGGDDWIAVSDTIFGVLLLLLGVGGVLVARRGAGGSGGPDDAVDPSAAAGAASDRRTGIGSAYLLGIAVMIGNFSTILLYLPAMHEVSVSTASDAARAAVVAVAALITALPALGPLALRVALPQRSGPWFDAVHRVVTRHQHAIGAVVCLVLGAYLLAKGLRG